MNQEITDYEEAKEYIQSAVDGAYDRWLKRKCIIEFLVFTIGGSALVIIACIIMGVNKGDLSMVSESFKFVPAIAFLGVSALVPIYKRYTAKKLIIKGVFFEHRRQIDVIREANYQKRVVEAFIRKYPDK